MPSDPLPRRGVRRFAVAFGLAMLGVVVGLFAVVAQPPLEGDAGPLRIRIDPQLGKSDTVVDLAPGGTLSADTHPGPIGLVAEVEQVDVERTVAIARNAAESDSRAAAMDAVTEPVAEDLSRLVTTLAARSLVFAAGAGMVAALILPRRRLRYVIATTGTSVLTVLVLGAVVYVSFDPAAFSEPELAGPVAELPDLVDTVSSHVESFEDVEGRVNELSRRLNGLYAQIGPPSDVPGEVVWLHVSDIHSNPVGVETLRAVASDFDVDAVIDTGDLTSFGATDAERTVIDQVADTARRIDVPYYLVPGNHDSGALRTYAAAEGLRVLDGTTVTIDGLRLYGLGDLSFTATNELSRQDQEANDRRLGRRAALAARTESPDVLAMHNPHAAGPVVGEVPVILAGHTHDPEVAYEDGTVVVTAGSTGAGGLEALSSTGEFEYEMQLLRFVDDRLVAVDQLAFRGTDGAFQFERVLIDPDRIDAYREDEREGAGVGDRDRGGEDPDAGG